MVAGALDFSDALRLVALRGDLMERAYPHGYGLTAIVGLTLSQLEKLMAGSNTYIANINAETQTVIAGRDEDMAAVAQKALDAGPTARCWISRRRSWPAPSARSRCRGPHALI